MVAEGSISAVMDGRRYNRGVRFHKLMYEAFMRLVWKGFIPWLQESHEDSKDVVNSVFNDLKKLQDQAWGEKFEKQMLVLYLHNLRRFLFCTWFFYE